MHTSYKSFHAGLRRNQYMIKRDLLQNINQRGDEHKLADDACSHIYFFIQIYSDYE